MNLDAREVLEFRQAQLKHQITASLDLLEGLVYLSPSQQGHHVHLRLGGKARTKHVRKRLVPRARAMTDNYRRVRQLLIQLSEVNWRLLQLPPQG
jgi:hypothetical protein